MKIIYAQEPLSKKGLSIGYSVFLAGPTPRADTPVPSWRPELIRLLGERDHRLVREVLVPEPRDGVFKGDYLGQVNWEEEAIAYCDILAFWIPRDVGNKMPGFTTNVEFGWWLDKKDKIILGWPHGTEKVRYLEYKFKKHRAYDKIVHTMEDMVNEIIGCTPWKR